MKRKIHDLKVTPTYSSEKISSHLYEFVKTYIYKLTHKHIKSSHLEIISVVAGVWDDYFSLKLLTVSDDEGGSELRVNERTLFATVRYDKKIYQIAISHFKQYDETTYFIFQAQGVEEDARLSKALLDYIKQQSIIFSNQNNSTLEVLSGNGNLELRPITISNDSLSELFLPSHINESISLFVDTLKKYPEQKKSLRYLFSGKPGTAKTKIVRSIANACKGKGTFIFTNGSETRIDQLFELTKIFSPVVICIDDIDLMTGSREDGSHSRELAAFLQKMDGFVDTNFFFLATTNDKKLVDIAASRPGRFDMIIDVNQIESNQYLSLVKSKTGNEKILRLFDDNLLGLLHDKKVTGAFISNLVKHLELMDTYKPAMLSEWYVTQMIVEQQNGFYGIPEFERKKIGFAN